MAEERTEYGVEVARYIRDGEGLKLIRRVEYMKGDADGPDERELSFEKAEWINRVASRSEAVVMKRTVTYGDWEKA